MVNSLILTEREKEVISKKLRNKKLNQQDSNYLSRFVRPKLREISRINAKELLNKLDYNQKAISLNNKIIKLILQDLKEIKAIVIYGSAIQNNYKNYNDIDVMIILKELKLSLAEKYRLINNLEESAKKHGLKLDIQILTEKDYYSQYNTNPNLIYQLKDSKIIYGNIKLPSSIEIYKKDLEMKLDYSLLEDESSDSQELYNSLRNIILIRLLSRGIVDNYLLNSTLIYILGDDLISRLKTGRASKEDKRNALRIMQATIYSTINDLRNSKWEKIKR